MKLFSKANFGLKVLLDIAINEKNQVYLDEIAIRHKISERYLEVLIYQLERKGLIKKEKTGVGVMYSILKPPNEITITEIIEVFEEKFIIDSQNTDEQCLKIENIIDGKVWNIIWSEIKEKSDKITLEELIKGYEDSNIFMEYI